jgi:hypothetical protein
VFSTGCLTRKIPTLTHSPCNPLRPTLLYNQYQSVFEFTVLQFCLIWCVCIRIAAYISNSVFPNLRSVERWLLICSHSVLLYVVSINIHNINQLKCRWVGCYCDFFLIIKPTRCTTSQIYSWNETLHVTDSYSIHHQEFFTVYTAMVYVSKAVCRIPLLCVQWKTPDDGQRNCLKHVE